MTVRIATPEEVAALLRPADTLVVPLGPGQPLALLHALAERDDWDGLQVFSALLTDFFRVFTHPGVELLSGFFGPVERALRDAGHRVAFLPGDFRRFVRFARQLEPRVVATAATPPDANGSLSLSLHAGATVDEIHRCARDPERLLVVETSPALPVTRGLEPHYDHAIRLDEVDVLIEGDRMPLALEEKPPGQTDRAIARRVACYVRDGATLQTGIGGIPNQIVRLLAEADGGDFGIHSEMFTTGLMELHEAGKVSNRRKGLYDGYSIATFALGSRRLYEWLDGNEQVRFLPVELVNDPTLIARNRNMVSINGALAVDLVGQVVADTIAGTQYSGIGGHEDFVGGAGMRAEDRSILCLPATVEVDGELRSRIVEGFAPGTPVTTPRHQVDVVVTEYGAAELAGRTVEERAEALARIAHPEFRDDLLGRARRIGHPVS